MTTLPNRALRQRLMAEVQDVYDAAEGRPFTPEEQQRVERLTEAAARTLSGVITKADRAQLRTLLESRCRYCRQIVTGPQCKVCGAPQT